MKGQVLQNTPSGVTNWLAGTLIDVGDGFIEIEFDARPDMCNPIGTLHGGTAAMILDDVIGMCMFSLGKSHVYTSLTLNVDFMGGIKLGGKMRAKANIIKQGRQIVVIEAMIYDEKGRKCYRGHCNMIKNEKFPIN